MASERVKLEFTRDLTHFHLMVLTDYDNMMDYMATAEACRMVENSIDWYNQVVNTYSNISKHYNSLLFKLDIAVRQELITVEEYEEYKNILKRSFNMIDVMDEVEEKLRELKAEFKGESPEVEELP